MAFYFGTNYQAERVGIDIKDTRCEKCSCEYSFPVIRVGTGKSTSHYNIQALGSLEKATAKAELDVQKRLKKDMEICPCPQCGWVQEAMIKSVKKQQSNGYFWPMLIFVLLSIPVLGLCGLPLGVRTKPWEVLLTFVILGTFTWIPAIVFIILWRKNRAKVNPNSDFDGRPRPVPGAMPSVIRVLDNSGQTVGLEMIHPAEPIIDKTWVHACIPLLRIPEVCSECLAATEEVIPVPFGLLQIPIQTCRSCAKKIAAERTRKMLIWAPFMAAVGALNSFTIFYFSGSPQDVLNIMTVFGAIAGALLGAGIGYKKSTVSVEIKVVSKPRGIAAIRAHNTDYHKMLIHNAGLHDIFTIVEKLPEAQKADAIA